MQKYKTNINKMISFNKNQYFAAFLYLIVLCHLIFFFFLEQKQGNLISINRKLDAILAILNEQYPSSIANCASDLLPNFPLNSMEVFDTFCNDLKNNEELRNQFVS